jgi:hypothetical protein
VVAVSHAAKRTFTLPRLGRVAEVAGWLSGRALVVVPTIPGLAGSALVSYGAAMVYRPAGFITGGAFLLWLGTEMNRRR